MATASWTETETDSIDLMPIQVAIVEDNEDIRGTLERILGRAANMKCVGSYACGQAALDAIPKKTPNVVIMDIRLPDFSGIECTARLKQLLPKLQVLIFTVHEDSEQVFKSLEAGASGYLLKRSTPAEIIQAVQDVHGGGAPMSGEIARKVVQSFRKPADVQTKKSESEQLTDREEEVLNLLAQGYISKEIADRMAISYDTVRFHLKHIYTKLHVRSRMEAVVKYKK